MDLHLVGSGRNPQIPVYGTETGRTGMTDHSPLLGRNPQIPVYGTETYKNLEFDSPIFRVAIPKSRSTGLKQFSVCARR